MNRSQKYISLLLERLPKWELRSYEHQTTLDQLRNRISSAPDIHNELLRLYRVKGFSDFAMSLMWIADKVATDPTLEESTLDEETLVFTKFKQAIGDLTAPEQNVAPSSAVIELPSSPSSETAQESDPAPTFDSMWGATPQQSIEPVISNNSQQGGGQEHNFASLLERFLESVQSGNDDRTALLSEVIHECNNTLSSSTAGSDYKNFCQLLVEFLQYITDNQFLDDVRVMNIVSNIQDPFAQWTRADKDNRSGILDQAIDILRDFKTMFE